MDLTSNFGMSYIQDDKNFPKHYLNSITEEQIMLL